MSDKASSKHPVTFSRVAFELVTAGALVACLAFLFEFSNSLPLYGQSITGKPSLDFAMTFLPGYAAFRAMLAMLSLATDQNKKQKKGDSFFAQFAIIAGWLLVILLALGYGSFIYYLLKGGNRSFADSFSDFLATNLRFGHFLLIGPPPTQPLTSPPLS